MSFERCVISKGVKTEETICPDGSLFERCVISKGVKTAHGRVVYAVSLRGV